jgi:MinD-like ATPase involved in chromosome partitioning or flagellar assembly
MEVLGLLGIGPHGVRVAPSANDPKRALDRETFLWLYENLKAYAEVMVLDCGTGLFDDPAQAAVETADQLVVVVDGEPDTMQMVASGECQQLLRAFDGPVFLVVNKLTRRVRRRVNLGEFEQELSFAHGIVEVGYDEKAAASLSKFRWDDRPPKDWAVRIRELAALLTTSWPTV